MLTQADVDTVTAMREWLERRRPSWPNSGAVRRRTWEAVQALDRLLVAQFGFVVCPVDHSERRRLGFAGCYHCDAVFADGTAEKA